MVQIATVAANGDRGVIDIVICAHALTCRGCGRHRRIIILNRRGTNRGHSIGVATLQLIAKHADTCIHCDGVALINGYGQSRLGHNKQFRVGWRLRDQIDEILQLLAWRIVKLLLVAIDIGLKHRHLHALGLRLIGKIDPQREHKRQNNGHGCLYIRCARAQLPGFINKYITDQYPHRATHHASVFVPLHSPHIARKTVTQRKPWERNNLSVSIEVLCSHPCCHQHRVGYFLRSTFAHIVEEHKGHHVPPCREECCSQRACGCSNPNPPHRSGIPENKAKSCPPCHAPPVARRRAQRVTYI